MTDKWEEVISLAARYGFITLVYGGVAVLATPENQELAYGTDEFKKIQEMNKLIKED